MARIIFIRENIRFLRKYYVSLVSREREAHLHDLIEYELEYLPPLHEEDYDSDEDVGQNDHLLEF